MGFHIKISIEPFNMEFVVVSIQAYPESPPINFSPCSLEKTSDILLQCVSLCGESGVVTQDPGEVLGTPGDS